MPAIDVRAATNSAIEYLKYVEDLVGNSSMQDLRLEEAELSDDKGTWSITLGYDVNTKEVVSTLGGLSGITNPTRYRREYKVFKVNSETGEVEAMNIRKV
jgi:hypothetical protein